MIKDKVVIITGASSGIGEATAKKLARNGAKVVLGARREDKLKSIAEEISSEGGQVVYQVLDVTRQTDNDEIAKLAKDRFGGVDAIFLNAGLMPSSPLSALKTDEWHKMVDVNIKGVLNGLAAVLPTFVEQKSGHVIATSSVAGLKAYPNGAVYGGTNGSYATSWRSCAWSPPWKERTFAPPLSIRPQSIPSCWTPSPTSRPRTRCMVCTPSSGFHWAGLRTSSLLRWTCPKTPRSTSSP
jgi:NAD(P)-dependent dehydrogenase (short-subunit alcohol dehydrogenase family)